MNIFDPSTIKLEPFQPPFWLRNPHAQTVFHVYFGEVPRLPYRRERIETPDGDFLDLDWIDGDPDSPLVLACHGLEGCSRAKYMMRFMKAVQDAGWTGLSLNFRGCSGEPNRLLRAYHSGDTGDLYFVIHTICRRHPNRPLFLAGHSLGGNVICKWLGEREASVPPNLIGAGVCSVPYQLSACQRKLDGRMRWVYVEYFLRSLRRKIKSKQACFPNAVDYRRIRRSNSFETFDDAYTAPVHGFQDYRDYYTRSSSYPFLPNIRVPVLLIHALDDPFTPKDSLPKPDVIENPHLRYFYQSHGGHLGFYDRRYGSFWLAKQLMRWFHALQELHPIPMEKVEAAI